jgi:hypothetical protein
MLFRETKVYVDGKNMFVYYSELETDFRTKIIK